MHGQTALVIILGVVAIATTVQVIDEATIEP